MNKHPYRALVIWATLAIALFNIYPTVGWMLSSPQTRDARLAQWKAEDDEWAKTRQSAFADFWHSLKRWAEFDRNRVINLGLDLQGGVHMVLSFDWEELPEQRKQELLDSGYRPSQIQELVQQQVLQQITRRVNDFEAKEPVIQTLGDSQVQIQLPGEKDIQRAKRLITQTAQLNFHAVAGSDETLRLYTKLRDAYPDQFLPYVNRPLPGEPFTVTVENFQRVREILTKAQADGVLPADKIIRFSQPPKPYDQQRYQLYVLDKEPLARGEGLTSATAGPDQERPPYWAIFFQLNSAAGAEFAKATAANMGRAMAIVVDESVISAPTINGVINTSGQITGNFEGIEARDLAIALNSGSMVVPVHEQMSRVVGASLGADAVHKGVVSSIAGLIAVGLFMVFYYLKGGVIALIALILNAIYILALMAYFKMTLTLPGIAGLILTVGMAVDSNVLIYERLREELKLGHTLLSSIENSYRRVAETIIDANMTTLIAAAVLFQFGTGPIEGFAITLCIGIFTTVFCSLVVSHALTDYSVAKGWIKTFKMLNALPRRPKIRWMRMGWAVSLASVIVIAIGLSVFGIRGQNMFGVDFTEGTTMELNLVANEGIPVDAVRVALANAGFTAPVVQEFGEGVGTSVNSFLIRVGDVDVLQQSERKAETDAASEQPASLEAAPAAPAEATPPAEPATAAPAADTAAPATAPEAQPQESPAADGTGGPAASAEAETDTAGSALAGVTVSTRVKEALAPLTDSKSADGVEIIQEQTVGPAVGKQLRWDAVKAVLASFFFIMVYCAFRFEIKYSVGAVAALFHDVLITVGFFAIFGLEIDMNVIAALLTLIGYSINDTIVIFDRVREDMRLYRGKGMTFPEIMDLAINATMSRTIITALLTWFTVAVLAIFGGSALRGFALALVFGIIAGSYSSVCIASPIAYWWQKIQDKRDADSNLRMNQASARRKKPTAKA